MIWWALVKHVGDDIDYIPKPSQISVVLSPHHLRGVSIALIAGCIFGFQFVPIEYLKLCDDDEHSCEDLDYLFGYFTGIAAGSTVFLAVYSAYMNNIPQVFPRAILPGICAGVLWGIGSGELGNGLLGLKPHTDTCTHTCLVSSSSSLLQSASSWPTGISLLLLVFPSSQQ